MKIKNIHKWDINYNEAKEIQVELASRVVKEDFLADVKTVCGVDISFKNGNANSAVVVLSFPQLLIIDYVVKIKKVDFPYIPGLLSFREIPPLMDAFQDLEIEPDLLIVDGQGIAHPRRLGLAAHLGLLIDKPIIGCAKSRLIGTHDMPDEIKGSYEYLYDKDEIIGAVVRTRDNVKPVYVSIGHKISLESAIDYIIKCSIGHRIPEPTRMAHKIAGGLRPVKLK